MSAAISKHYTVTLTGSAQALPATGVSFGAVRWMSMQPDGANTNPIFLGGAGVTTSDYGTRLPAGTAGIPPAPHIIAEFRDGMLRPEALYVIGTLNEKLHLHVISYPENAGK